MTTKHLTQTVNKFMTAFFTSLSTKNCEFSLDNVKAEFDSEETQQSLNRSLRTFLSKADKQNNKDVNAPHRALSSYIFFSSDARKIVKEKFPDLETKKITSELGRMWKALSDEKKLPYQQMALADQERYRNELASYVPPPRTNVQTVIEPKVARVRAESKPTGYSLFTSSRRVELKEQNASGVARGNGETIMAQLGAEWSALTPEQKAEWKTRAASTSPPVVVQPPVVEEVKKSKRSKSVAEPQQSLPVVEEVVKKSKHSKHVDESVSKPVVEEDVKKPKRSEKSKRSKDVVEQH